jgi:hypothetical protein
MVAPARVPSRSNAEALRLDSQRPGEPHDRVLARGVAALRGDAIRPANLTGALLVFPILSSERLSLLCLAGRVQPGPGLSHGPLLLEASRDAVRAGRVLQPKSCCRLAEGDARLLANECEEIVSHSTII